VAGLSSRDGLCAFALLLWRRRTILDLARRDIDDELGELSGIAGGAACREVPEPDIRNQRLERGTQPLLGERN
jgi:hypothetical protein